MKFKAMEECISVFDMLKIGIGPSSSHTLGPWRAAERFLGEIRSENLLENHIYQMMSVAFFFKLIWKIAHGEKKIWFLV
jgi:hypothetical protein